MSIKGYVLLGNIYDEFKVTVPTINNTLKKLDIDKKYKERRAYIREEDYQTLVKHLELSNRVKKIVDIDKEELEIETHKDEIFKLKINHLEEKVEKLNEQLEFKNKEIESFHSIIKVKEESADALKEKLLLLEAEKEKELEGKEELISSLEEQLVEERQAREVVIGELNQYKEMKFRQRLKFLFKK